MPCAVDWYNTLPRETGGPPSSPNGVRRRVVLRLIATDTNLSGQTDIQGLALQFSTDDAPEYVTAVRGKLQATSNLVEAFVSLSAQGNVGPSDEQLRKRCQEAETEVGQVRVGMSGVLLTFHSVPP